MNNELLLRMRDVGICLYYASEYDLQLKRIQLQKLIYLLDCAGSFINIISIKHGHKTYHHGPYDQKIQNAVDILVFYKLANVLNVRKTDTGVICDYCLTDDGISWVESIKDSNKTTNYRALITKSLLDSLIKRKLFHRIIDLVYSEPLYLKNKPSGYGMELDFSNLDENDSFNYLSMVLDACVYEKQENLIPFLSDLFIDYLYKRSIALAAINVED